MSLEGRHILLGITGSIGFRVAQWLGGIDGRNPEFFPRIARKPVVATQRGAHLGQQRVLHRLAEIADANLRGIDLSASGTGDHDGQLAALAESDHRHLGANLVNGVDNGGEIPIEHCRHVVGSHEVFDTANLAGRIDGPKPFRHGIDLRLAVDVAQGMNLPVGVGFGHHVEIDQGDAADARAG